MGIYELQLDFEVREGENARSAARSALGRASHDNAVFDKEVSYHEVDEDEDDPEDEGTGAGTPAPLVPRDGQLGGQAGAIPPAAPADDRVLSAAVAFPDGDDLGLDF